MFEDKAFKEVIKLKGESVVASSVKNLPTMQETRVQFLGGEDPLEKEMATHSSILAWEIPWTEKLGCGSCGRKGVRHDLVTKHHQHTPHIPVSCSFHASQ